MKLPITLNYDSKKIIGEATLSDEELEKLKAHLDNGDYTFKAGYEIVEQEGKEIKKVILKEITLVTLPKKYGYR